MQVTVTGQQEHCTRERAKCRQLNTYCGGVTSEFIQVIHEMYHTDANENDKNTVLPFGLYMGHIIRLY